MITQFMIEELMQHSDIDANIVSSHYFGCSCLFIKLNDEWGMKCYVSEYERDSCYSNQRILATANLAPPVGIRFETRNFYCYTTRVAIVCKYSDFPDDAEYDKICNKVNSGLYPLFDKLIELQNEHIIKGGIADRNFDDDVCSVNVGVYEGEVVVVDCGFGYPDDNDDADLNILEMRKKVRDCVPRS